MNKDEEIIQASIAYLNENKQIFLKEYTKHIEASSERMAIFTAGMSGVGKTELAVSITENYPHFLHIDTDEIRNFFKVIGYDGQNARLYQKVASRGFSELFTYGLKNHFSLIMDSNFANTKIAIQNIERLLKKSYRIEIFYLYDEPTKCLEYATRRELVTRRKVPKDVFVRSNINSYKIVIEIKEKFKSQVYLHFFDKRTQEHYQNIEVDFLKKSIGENYDTYH